MSKLQVDNIVNKGDNGAPTLSKGAIITGIVTATGGSFSGNVSVGGTLTYEDVTNIDSVGLITARKGIVATGVVTATSFSGSGANLTGVESGVSDFVASGNIPNGASVVINTDGTVGIITQTASTDPDNPEVGSPTVFASVNAIYMSAVFDSNSNKVVIAYRDQGNNNYGTAVVGTVTPTTNSISFGTPVVFESASTLNIGAAFDSNSNKIVIAYRDGGDSDYGKAIVGTVSGTSISFGTPVAFNSTDPAYFCTPIYDSSNNKIVIAYRDGGNSEYGTAIVGTVSGTSISFGTKVVFESARCDYISAAFDSTNNKIVIAYQDDGNSSYGTAIVGTVSGTSISFGSATVYESANIETSSVVHDSSNNKIVIAFSPASGSHGKAVVGTVSGTSISFGSVVTFRAAATAVLDATFDSNNNKVVIGYKDQGNSQYGTAIVGTVSGTSISFGTAVVFESADSDNISATFDSNSNKSVIVYRDGANSSYGTAVVFDVVTFLTNLTTENYIGIAAAGISSGATGKITIPGGINAEQTGLTTAKTYYVQNNGGIGLNASIPSVVAGTSISSTKIVIR